VTHTHKKVSQQPPKREVRYHYDYCHRDGHLAEFCFRRKRDERWEYELNKQNMYRSPHGVHVRLFRGTVLGQEMQCLKVLGLRLRDHAVVVVVMPGVVQVMINMTLDLVVVAFSPTALADHVFPHVVPAFLKWDMTCLVFLLTFFQGK
jgi:hypothetical protein